MFFTAKIQAISGAVIGAFALIAAKQMCKQRKTPRQSAVPAKLAQNKPPLP
tara:strand:- start:2697 stop:2849 length:153 start_codon:yes stop_codon:yes gene_type:complete